MIYRPKNIRALENHVKSAIDNANITPDQVNLILTGYAPPPFAKSMFPDAQLFNYKQLCGEYPTSTAFAMAIGAKAIQNDEKTKKALGLKHSPNNIIIYNQAENIHHSIIILSKA